MNFGRAKTILIYFFIVVNIFLIYNILSMSENRVTVSEETLNDTVKILSSNGIELKEGIVLSGYENMPSLELSNPIAKEEKFASLLCGENKKESISYKGEKGILTIYDDIFLFEITQNYRGKEIKSAMPSAKTSKTVLKFLSSLGIDTTYFVWSGTLDKGKGVYEVSFVQKYMSNEFFNSKIVCEVKKDGVYSVKGKYFNIDSASSLKKIKSPLEIFLSFSGEYGGKDKSIIINDITTGYYTEQNSNEFSVLPGLPCYKLTLRNGNIYFYDAFYGSFIAKREF